MNMKKLFLLGFGIFINLSIAHAGKFEGSFSIKVEPGKSNVKKEMATEMEVSMKGNQILVMPNGPEKDKGAKTKFLLNTTDNTTMILMDNNGNKHAMKRATNEQGMRTNPHDDTKVTETKENKVIDGYKCRKVVIESGTSKTEAWFTNEVELLCTDLSLALTAARGPGADWAGLGTKQIQGCPILLTTTDKKTKAEHTLHIVNIKKGPVDEKLFSTVGYTISEMPGPPPRPGQGRPNGPGNRPGMPNSPGNVPGAPPVNMSPDGRNVPPPMPPANPPTMTPNQK